MSKKKKQKVSFLESALQAAPILVEDPNDKRLSEHVDRVFKSLYQNRNIYIASSSTYQIPSPVILDCPQFRFVFSCSWMSVSNMPTKIFIRELAGRFGHYLAVKLCAGEIPACYYSWKFEATYDQLASSLMDVACTLKPEFPKLASMTGKTDLEAYILGLLSCTCVTKTGTNIHLSNFSSRFHRIKSTNGTQIFTDPLYCSRPGLIYTPSDIGNRFTSIVYAFISEIIYYILDKFGWNQNLITLSKYIALSVIAFKAPSGIYVFPIAKIDPLLANLLNLEIESLDIDISTTFSGLQGAIGDVVSHKQWMTGQKSVVQQVITFISRRKLLDMFEDEK